MVEEKQRGGRRVLCVTPGFLVALAKLHDGMPRSVTVERPIPEDARIMGGRIAWARGNVIEIVLESAEWQDNSATEIERLEPPRFTVCYGEAEE